MWRAAIYCPSPAATGYKCMEPVPRSLPNAFPLRRCPPQPHPLCYTPPLTSLQVHHPVDYARVVSRIGNEMDLTLVDLDDILPAATVMVVTVRKGGRMRGSERRGGGYVVQYRRCGTCGSLVTGMATTVGMCWWVYYACADGTAHVVLARR